ncbi:MAG: hypothetical protein R3Y51_01365 [Rikenellaceae bacterium]
MSIKDVKKKNIFKLSYEQINYLRGKSYKFMRNVVVGFILASTVNFVVFNFVYSPKIYSLTKENNELLVKYKLLSNKINSTVEQLNEIKSRDNGTYKTMFAIDSVSTNLNDLYVFDNYIDDYAGNQFGYFLENLWSEVNNLKAD